MLNKKEKIVMKKKISFLLIIVISLIFSAIPMQGYADIGDPIVLTVKEGSTEKMRFSLDQLITIMREQDSQETYSYSGYNTYGTAKGPFDSRGPDLKSILNVAFEKTEGDYLEELDDDKVIRFVAGTDSYMVRMTVKQLKQPRYYYPNGPFEGENRDTEKGSRGSESSREDKAEVPVIIHLGESGHEGEETVLRVGQVAPNEQNWPLAVKDIAQGTNGGQIIIEDSTAQKIPSFLTISVSGRAVVYPGENIKLDYPVLPEVGIPKIYYTTNGTNPTMDSDIYNYNSFVPSQTRTITVPATAGGTFTIKAFSMKYGRLDSDVQTFSYKIVPIPKQGVTYTVGSSKYKITRSAASAGSAAYMRRSKKTYKTSSVPANARINGYTFKITSVADKAFRKNKKLKKVTIGTNVTKIGKQAFYGDKKLKTIVIKSKKITKCGKAAFKGINKKAIIKVPKSKLKKYRKLFKNKGQAKTVKIVKL